MIEDLADAHGVVLRRDVLAAGADDNWLRRQVRGGGLVRMRQGAYAVADLWHAAGPVDRHLLLVAAVMRQYGEHVAASHVSACLLQGGPSWGLPLESVHVTHLHGITERNAARVRHHRGECRAGDLTRVDGHWLTSPLRTAMDTASLLPRDPAVAVLDSFLNRSLVTDAELQERLRTVMREWPNSLALIRVLQLSDGRSESVGETRTRLLVSDAGLPAPVLQFRVEHPSGRLVARVDLAWPEHRLLLEFDGRSKYLELRRPGETVADAVLREKRREDHIREITGFRLMRLTWSDLEMPERTVSRIRRGLAGAAA